MNDRTQIITELADSQMLDIIEIYGNLVSSVVKDGGAVFLSADCTDRIKADLLEIQKKVETILVLFLARGF